jgi:penicillin-insensitive murein endopeptidase
MRQRALSFLGTGHFVPQLLAVLILIGGSLKPDSPAAAFQAPRPPPTTARAKSGPSKVVFSELDIEASKNPLSELSATEIQSLLAKDLGGLGPISIGRPNRGSLYNPIALTATDGIEVMNEERNFGTRVTVDSLLAAVAEVRARFPDAPKLRVGDISRERGGYIRPHRSHQTGLDIDLGYYYATDARWYTKANAENLDREKTWALVKALIAQGTVEYMFMDRSVQALLREHALSRGESPEWVLGLFQKAPRTEAMIRHTWGHLTHFHVRFSDPAAESAGRRLAPYATRLAVQSVKARVAKAPAPKRRVQAKAKRR